MTVHLSIYNINIVMKSVMSQISGCSICIKPIVHDYINNSYTNYSKNHIDRYKPYFYNRRPNIIFGI